MSARSPTGRRSLPKDASTAAWRPCSSSSAGTSAVSINTLGKHAAGAERFRDRGQRTPYGGFVTQIVQDVPDRDDRVRVRERVVREHDLADVFCISGNVTCQLEHRRRCVSSHHAMSCLEEVAGKEAAPTADLND